jgi:hypothetical protein
MNATCSQCNSPYAETISNNDVAHLGDETQGRILVRLGIWLSKTIAKGYFRDVSFCRTCKVNTQLGTDTFRAVNVLSLIGFMTFLFPPAGWIFFVAAFVILRFRLRQFRDQPSPGGLHYAVQGMGMFLMAFLLHTLIFVVLCVVVWMVLPRK